MAAGIPLQSYKGFPIISKIGLPGPWNAYGIEFDGTVFVRLSPSVFDDDSVVNKPVFPYYFVFGPTLVLIPRVTVSPLPMQDRQKRPGCDRHRSLKECSTAASKGSACRI